MSEVKVPEVMQFQLKHPANGETRTVEFTRDEIAHLVDEEIREKLAELVCECGGPVGETNHVDHNCDEYADEFHLLAAAPAAPAVQQPVEITDQTAPDGLYAVLYRDNWDGQGDTYHLLARKRNGAWFADESGNELFEYKGDAILRIWPLDADVHPAHPDAALVALLDAVTPHVIDCVRCGLSANGRLRDGTHPALDKLHDAYRAALSARGGES